VVDDYHGIHVADPYRWLEQLDSPATADWVTAEVRLTSDFLGHIPQREAMRRRLSTLWNYSRTDVPWREAGRLFYVENSGTQLQPVLYMQNTLHDPPRVVLDPQEISPDGSIAVGDFAVSPDGRWVAYSMRPAAAMPGDTCELPPGTVGTAGAQHVGTACWTQNCMHTPSPRRVTGRAR
jgi:prolyl oligopeptidase